MTVNSDPPILSRTVTPSIPFFLPLFVFQHKHLTHSRTMSTLWWREACVCALYCRALSLTTSTFSLSISLCGSVLPATLLAPVCRCPGCCNLSVTMLEHTYSAQSLQKKASSVLFSRIYSFEQPFCGTPFLFVIHLFLYYRCSHQNG